MIGWVTSAFAGTTRLALLVGANDGGPDRVTLRYGVDDARLVQQVLVDVGGVAPADVTLLEDPDPRALRAALEGTADRARALAAAGERVEVVLYYSGHSDPDGIRLGRSLFPYDELRGAFDALPADTGLLVLDSCASGAFVRAKGLALDDAANRTSGRAVLTSSAATEASQESDALGGSFFTFALVAGLRGAADQDADGRITLTEAYHYTFDATRFATAGTRAGAQHPAREVQLVGTGDLVLTDLRTSGARLDLARDIGGRLFVRELGGALVVEVAKPPGQPLSLNLPEGLLSLTLEAPSAQLGGVVALTAGTSRALTLDDLHRVSLESTRSRGAGSDRRTVPWVIAGSLLGISAVSGAVAAQSSGGPPWYASDTPLEQVSSGVFILSGGIGGALAIGLAVDALGRSR